MKSIERRLKKLIVILLFVTGNGYGQSCPVSFTTSYNQGGNVSFLATAPGTNAPIYLWAFGNSTTFTSSINQNTASVTYTANGVYSVSLTYSSTVTGCVGTTMSVITITNACNLTVNFTPPNPSNSCTGSATVINTGICGVPNYTWSNGSTFASTSGLCPGTYTVGGSSPLGCCPVMFTVVSIPCISGSPNFTYTQLGNGVVSFSSTSTGTLGSTTFTWNFGDGSPFSSGATANHTYTANGVYNVFLFVSYAPSCGAQVQIPITISSISPCTLDPDFSYSFGPNGSVNFLSTSTGTIPATTYTWNFGDGFTSTNGTSVAHTYSSNGTYSVTIFATNASTTCGGDTTRIITITNVIPPCPLNATFNFSTNPAGNVNFYSTSTGTTAGSQYAWSYGDGNFGTGAVSNHTYSNNATYTVQLAVTNSTNCVDTQTTVITVTNAIIPCQLNANYTHTVGFGGLVIFNNTSTGTDANTTYYWDFGDGVYSTSSSPSHTYLLSGAYIVMLRIVDANNTSCRDSSLYSINVTGLPCIANAAFNLSPGNQPQYWDATPVYPWNATSAVWYWGDGTSSNGLYTSHTYSVSGAYNICLTLTVSCGAVDSVCNLSAIYKESGSTETQGLIHINVLKPGLVNAIHTIHDESITCSVFPNPNPGDFYIALSGLNADPLTIEIYTLIGQRVYRENHPLAPEALNLPVHLPEVESGIYFIKITNDGKTTTKKMVITR